MKRRIYNHVPAILFWAATILVSLGYLGTGELWGSENRWAEVVREMHLTGDYFHPTINGEPYFDKPLLGYWLIALVSVVTGHLNEWTVRFPSVVAGLVALAATMNLGHRLWSREHARTAGWILLSAFGFLFWTRTAEADMENLAAIILAVAWYWARRDKPGFLSYFVFYAICFLGAQTKGLVAIVVPLLVIFPDVIRENRWKSYLSLGHLLALAAGLCVYLVPFAYAETTRTGYQASGLWLVFRENIMRYFRPFDHKEPFYVYFRYLPQSFFPWIPLLVASIWAAITWFRRLDWPTKWLAISILLIFSFFTLSGSRRSYYILPILPFCALLASLYFDMEQQEKPRLLTRKIQGTLLVVVLTVELLSPIIWPQVERRTGFEAPGRLIWTTLALGILAALPLVMERLRPGLVARITGTKAVLAPQLVTGLVLVGGFLAWQQPITSTFGTMRAFCLELKNQTDEPGVQIAYFKKMSDDVPFYLDSLEIIRPVLSAKELSEFLTGPAKTKVLITRSDCHKELMDALPKGVATQPTLKEKTYPWEKEPKKHEAWIIRD